jgi:O-antigen ligase
LSGASEAARTGASRALAALLLLLAFSTSALGVANTTFAVAGLLWLWLVARERRWRSAFDTPITRLLGLFVGLLALSALFSLHPERSLPALKGVFTFLFVPLFADAMETEKDIALYTGAIAAAAVVLSFVGGWQYFHGADTLSDRITATLSHYMTFSGLMLLAALFSLGVALEGSRRTRIPAFAVAGLLGAVILLTFTRNAYVGFFAALIVYLAIRRPRWLAAIPALGVAVYLAAPPGIRARLLSTFDPSDPTNRDRLDMAVAGLRMIRDHPLFGLGLGLVKPYYPLYRVPTSVRWRVPHLHDNLLQIAAESGIFAAAVYVAVLVCFFSVCLARLRAEREPARRGALAGAFLAVCGITAAGFFEYNFGDVEVLMTTLILMAIPFSRAFRNDARN